MSRIPQDALIWLKKYLRYTDYIGAAQLYLKDNFLMTETLKKEHIKERILGHWGTVPGLNLIYAGLNYLISKYKCEMLLITGPGHGAPAILANLFAEKSLYHFYQNYPLDKKGMGRLIKDFSWPHSPFPSHVTPGVPGSILEGGELGYSLSTAFGAVLDNPNLIVPVVIGDGEAETGPIAAAWHSNKFLNPQTCGAVLPIVHINSYKISNPTIFGRMSDTELRELFEGYGYAPIIVEGARLEADFLNALEKAYGEIRAVQKNARKNKKVPLKPKWPVILMRSPKGWKGIHDFAGHPVEGSFHAHGIPIADLNKDEKALSAVEKWLRSYGIDDLVDKNGIPKKEVLKYVPDKKYALGMSKHAIGGNILKSLKLPRPGRYGVKVKSAIRGQKWASSVGIGAEMLRDIVAKNPRNFRVFCPDELESNKLGAILEVTKRAYLWPTEAADEKMAPDGRVMEILSEHTLQGWLQGYILTGRHGIFPSYEAFIAIVSSMVDQYAKFLKQSFKVKWRKPLAAAIYLLTSVGWRQDHNGYSHQNPSFVSNVLQKHGEFTQVYYPADANSLLVALEEVFLKHDSICVIVAGKRDLPQWLSLKEARKQAKKGIAVWEWVGGKEGTKNPDVVLASAGDYITEDALFAVKICRDLIPEIKIRYVNISEITSISIGDNPRPGENSEKMVNSYFTSDKPVVLSYHGYVNDMEQILWPYVSSSRFSLHGYRERGSTTTPFDMKVVNEVSCYHLVIDMISQAAKSNKKLAAKKSKIIKMMEKKIDEHQKYIVRFGDDSPEVKNLSWK